MSAPQSPMAPVQNRYEPSLPWYGRVNWAVFVIVVVVAAVTDWLDLGWIAAVAVGLVVYGAWEALRWAWRRRRPSGPE